MSTIRAVFENGVFRPLLPLSLPEHAEVELELHQVQDPARQSSDVPLDGNSRSGLVGLFADDPEAMDAVMEAINEHRERPWRLNE